MVLASFMRRDSEGTKVVLSSCLRCEIIVHRWIVLAVSAPAPTHVLTLF